MKFHLLNPTFEIFLRCEACGFNKAIIKYKKVPANNGVKLTAYSRDSQPQLASQGI
jgi:hypothetical protein